MKISKRNLKKVILEAFKPNSPIGDEIRSSEHVMSTILLRRLYAKLEDKESFFKNLELLDKAFERSQNIQGPQAEKFFSLESMLGNLQKMYEYEKPVFDLDKEKDVYDDFGFEDSDFEDNDVEVPPFDEDDEDIPLGFEDDTVPPFDEDDEDVPL